VSTVGSSALVRGLVDLDVLNDEVAGIETLGVGVRFGVLQEREEECGRLLGPPGSGDTELLSCYRKKQMSVRNPSHSYT
jgi:hypothetical protein